MRLKQIMVNLLSDAIKQTEDHGIVRILASYDDNQEQISFHVAQNGRGLLANDCAKINRLL